MKYSVQVDNVEITHDDLVNLFSTAELYSGNTFGVTVDPRYDNLAYNGAPDGGPITYEDALANVLLNGGSLRVTDIENSYDSYEEALEGTNNSHVLKPIDYEMCEAFLTGEQFFVPVYELTLDRIITAIENILNGHAVEAYTYNSSLPENFRNIFDEDGNGDYFDAWNLFQYIIFDEVIYG